MKIQILSDVHNEFLSDELTQSRSDFNYKNWEGNIPSTDADLIILAGDVDIGAKGVEWAIEESKRLDKGIIYIAGNHEYYGQEYYSNLKKMRNTAAGTNVHFLENNEIQIDDIRILGCTLWTDYNVVPKEGLSQCMKQCAVSLNDHRVIRIEGASYFHPANARKIHSESVKWLNAKLIEKTTARATLVVTHHGPSTLCQHRNYPVSIISGAFYSDLDGLVSQSDCWVYGHTHSNLDTVVNGCRLISNQAGYPGEDIFDFNSIKVIEV